MALYINNNVAAFNSYRNLSSTQDQLGKSLEKLSSGYRINRAADDAAGLAISEGLRSQVGGYKQAVRNAQDGISLVQTAEGALNEVHAMLQRMRDLSVQAANDTNSTESRANIETEYDQLQEELVRIADSTEFNGTQLLDGSATAINFQVGAQGNTSSAIEVSLVSANVSTVATAVNAGDFDNHANAQTRIETLDTQIQNVSSARATLGATQNRFEHTINNINVAVENLSASESRIRDTDMAKEMVQFQRNQVLTQAGTAMLSQANQLPQGVMQLLR